MYIGMQLTRVTRNPNPWGLIQGIFFLSCKLILGGLRTRLTYLQLVSPSAIKSNLSALI